MARPASRRRHILSLSGADEELIRDLAPRVLGALMRRYGGFEACEDAVQEACLAAALQWPEGGLPANPFGWLLSVASRRFVDDLRAETARRRREQAQPLRSATAQLSGAPDDSRVVGADDSLRLLLLCCHPALSPASQVALTLRAVGGLTTAQIARAFLVSEATMATRVSRAKQAIREAGATFPDLDPTEHTERLDAALHVLYLIFNEGYVASSGESLSSPPLAGEAIRLTRMAHRDLPASSDVAGLLALMLLTQARAGARTRDGAVVTLVDQDRSLWDDAMHREGQALVEDALASGPLSPYELQAAIAAVHMEAASPTQTDWPQILGLYDLLVAVAPGPVVSLNRAVAVAEVHGPAAALRLLEHLSQDPRLSHHHRFLAIRSELRARLGRMPEALEDLLAAAEAATNRSERDHLLRRARSWDSAQRNTS